MTVLFCVCSFLFFFSFFLVFYLNTTETHADTHSYFKGLYFFPCSCWSGPPSHTPALNCSGFGFIMVHVNVFVSAYIMGWGGGGCFFVPQNTVSDCGNNFFFFFFCLELNLGTERMERLAFGKKY